MYVNRTRVQGEMVIAFRKNVEKVVSVITSPCIYETNVCTCIICAMPNARNKIRVGIYDKPYFVFCTRIRGRALSLRVLHGYLITPPRLSRPSKPSINYTIYVHEYIK